MPLDSIIYQGKTDGSAFEIRTSERRNTWTPPEYLSAEMLQGTNVCGTRASAIFLIDDERDGAERFMLIKERHTDPEKDAQKYPGYKTVGGKVKRQGTDLSIEDGLLREAGDEGGFRIRDSDKSFIYEIDKTSVVPIGVKFAEKTGAVLFFLADLKNHPPEGLTDHFRESFAKEGKGNYISEIRYLTINEFFDEYSRHLEKTQYPSTDDDNSDNIMKCNDRQFIRRETKDILLEYARLTRPKKIIFTSADIQHKDPEKTLAQRLRGFFQRRYRPRHIPIQGDLRIPDKLRSDMLAKAGLDEELYRNSMNTCKAFLAHDKTKNLYESKLIVQTDLFFYELFIHIKYTSNARPPREAMEQEVEWFAKRYLINNFRAVLHYNMIDSYMVKPPVKRDSIVDRVSSDARKVYK